MRNEQDIRRRMKKLQATDLTDLTDLTALESAAEISNCSQTWNGY